MFLLRGSSDTSRTAHSHTCHPIRDVLATVVTGGSPSPSRERADRGRRRQRCSGTLQRYWQHNEAVATTFSGEQSNTSSEHNLSFQFVTKDYKLCQLVLDVKSKQRITLVITFSASPSQPRRTLSSSETVRIAGKVNRVYFRIAASSGGKEESRTANWRARR